VVEGELRKRGKERYRGRREGMTRKGKMRERVRVSLRMKDGGNKTACPSR